MLSYAPMGFPTQTGARVTGKDPKLLRQKGTLKEIFMR